ncbi:MAG: tannase/feruloyl esterase family alpha/beta hydrolase, partial [Sphingomonadaceae bacterium]
MSGLALAHALAFASTFMQGAAPASQCAGLAGQEYEGARVDRVTPVNPDPVMTPKMQSPQRSYHPVPVSEPFCRIEGRIEGTIGFELWLPYSWNGRLLGAGVGGDAGIFNYVDMSARLSQGFAAITTDSGHKASDARWMSNPKARDDYTHRASHLSAQAGKALAARFYGREV